MPPAAAPVTAPPTAPPAAPPATDPAQSDQVQDSSICLTCEEENEEVVCATTGVVAFMRRQPSANAGTALKSFLFMCVWVWDGWDR